MTAGRADAGGVERIVGEVESRELRAALEEAREQRRVVVFHLLAGRSRATSLASCGPDAPLVDAQVGARGVGAEGDREDGGGVGGREAVRADVEVGDARGGVRERVEQQLGTTAVAPPAGNLERR